MLGLDVKNFNMDWNDGKMLCCFLEVFCLGIIFDFENIDDKSFLENVIVVLNVVEDKLGVKKVLKLEEFISLDVDELSVMVYML